MLAGTCGGSNTDPGDSMVISKAHRADADWLRAAFVSLVLAMLVGCGALDQGLAIFTAQAKTALQADPVIRQHIGEIREIKIDEDASAEAPGEDEFVFDLVGSKGSGRVSADFITIDADTEKLGAGKLKMSDGREFAIEARD